jgi:hypothetical protein
MGKIHKGGISFRCGGSKFYKIGSRYIDSLHPPKGQGFDPTIDTEEESLQNRKGGLSRWLKNQ